MKKILTIVFLVYAFCSCSEPEIGIRDYPRIQTNEARETSTNGATLSFEILTQGNEEIISYGFVWDDNTIDGRPLLGLSEELEFIGKPTSNIFSANIEYDFIPEEIYNVRAFVRTNSYTVYGDIVLIYVN